ncbi:hypothetical protein ACK2SD_02075 [Pseudomonas sp. SC11]|uniref:hypothetical protein n=1 Tax=Pseudomonas sp. SC11 TaxID=326927 RepID=UPI00399B72EB
MWMKRSVALGILALVAACARTPEVAVDAGMEARGGQTPTMSSVSSAPLDVSATGVQAAEQLTRWYEQTRRDCGGATAPAYLCSGVMMRGTQSGQSWLPWDPSPPSVASGGVSFAWIRTDMSFSTLPLDYNNGYIFYPAQETPAGKNSTIQVLCSFPFDAWTDSRNQQSCGISPEYPTQSRACNEQGIDTAAKWITHFNSAPNKYKAQCGWNLRQGQPATADRFFQTISAKQLLSGFHRTANNELRLATWATGSGAQLPIQSFFYIAGSQGLVSAQDDQRRYFQSYQQIVPVIQLTLPASAGAKAAFVYRESDQAVGGGESSRFIDFENVAFQEGRTEISLPQARFYFSANGGNSKLAIRSAGTPSNGITGRFLHMTKNTANFSAELIIMPVTPASRIVLDVDNPSVYRPYNHSSVLYTDGTGHGINFPFPGFDFSAPAGKKIKYIEFQDFERRIDNIRFYD